MGRPKLELDEAEIERLAKAQCSNVRIAAAVGCDESTLRARFPEELARWRNLGKNTLEAAMMQKALDGNVPMQIHLSKQHLGHTDKTKVEVGAIDTFDPIEAYRVDPELRKRALQLERDIADADKALGTEHAGEDRFPRLAVPAPPPSSGGNGNGDAHRDGDQSPDR